MNPEESQGADVLGAAARTIGQMPEEAVQSKFAQLQQARKARTEREAIRQQAEADSLDGDEAAYQAGLMHEKSDLNQAVRWYRAAAVNDFPGASLKLAKVLAALAEEHYSKGETSAGEALIEEASDWCVKACAAGEFIGGETEAFDLMEELNARLDSDFDPDFRRPNLASGSPAADQCTHGGLMKVATMPNQAMKEHLDSCSSCKAELAELAARRAWVPVSR